MGEASAKNIPYGLHGMGGGIHPFHMEDTRECKDLVLKAEKRQNMTSPQSAGLPPDFRWP